MWNRLRFHPFLQVSQIFQRRKSDANKQDFENKLNLTCQARSNLKTILHIWSKFGGPSQCLKLSQKSCRSSCLESQITNIKLKKKSRKSSWSSSKVIGLGPADLWEFPTLVLAWKDDELSHGQAQNGVNFDFEGKFDLEGKCQSPPKTIGILTKVLYIYGSNLVILAWTTSMHRQQGFHTVK